MVSSSPINLSENAATLLIPLYIRYLESQRSDALLRDERAGEIIAKLNLDDSFFSQAQVESVVQVSILLRNRQFDRVARDYLSRHPGAIVVHVGCGLDTRFERVDNGQVEWYDLDLPEVMDLRRELISFEAGRYHQLACSVLDATWMEAVAIHKPRPFLLLAEGVFMFFKEDQVRRLILLIRDSFPSSELAFDAFSPFYAWGNNRRVSRTNIGAITHWALKRGTDLESWGEGIRLVSEWFPFLEPEPRLAHIRWVRYIPLLSRTTGIFHYQLG